MPTIVLILIILIFWCGLICLIYLPFKIWLLKSERLPKKLSRRINWIYFSIVCLVGITLISLRNYRTPSKERLEEISKIKLPLTFKVLRDEYQDMIQDYCIQYEIQFDNNGKKALIQNIKSSPFYNANSLGTGDYSSYITIDSIKAVWANSPKGYEFSKPYGLTTYIIRVDLIHNELSYQECSD